MAAAVRIRVAQLVQKHAFSLLTQPRCLAATQKLCFHNSYLLCVAGQEIKMPSLSPTMSEGTIVKWLKKEGDVVQPGDVLCDIQTDKAVVSFETEEEGVLAKILVPENTADVKVGTLIALMVAQGEDWKSVEVPASAGAPPPAPAPAPAPSAPTAPPPAPSVAAKPGHPETPHNIGPAVRLLLEQYGLQPSDIPGTGRGGKVLKGDVLEFVKKNALKPKPPKQVPPPQAAKAPPPGAVRKPAAGAAAKVKPPGAKFSDLELTNMRRTIAKRLTQSKSTIPHAYGSVKCTIDKILALRKQLKSDGISVSVNDFVVKAVANALLQYPEVNVHWIDGKIVHIPTVDVSIAVATDAGLITPIVKNAAGKGIETISTEIRKLAEKARSGKLQPHEFQGGSFTVSNLGMFGIGEFSAIINPPQCAILAVGGGKQVINSEGRPETRMVATLSYDNRAIEDTVAAQFLRAVGDSLDDPNMLLLGSAPGLRSELSS
ncbi:pyruvate dehydrogenase protein X component, mitochondrial-like [Schistocerca cancellata]|uniref:pyruvate dehydrogenase protein X component, mitochondrial-like n=1 Tax=Schistocerca cancellata TaxID=274614 RepID=UPI0021191C40|nr:pyruvate dehydrogenase protein X component, mitochondrial-like [Schistocerca cancellata]